MSGRSRAAGAPGAPSGEAPARDVFSRARLRLGILFAVIVVVLVAASSVLVYMSFRSDLRLAASGDFSQGETEAEFVTRSLDAFRWRLLVVDGAIILVVGIAGLLYARSTLRPIRDNMAAQKRFIADASHDLRTPLAVMRTEFEVALRDPRLDGAVRPVLGSGLEEVARMSQMVDDLLTLSRIDAHQEVVGRERVDLAAVARTTAEKLRPLAAQTGITLVAEAAAPVPADGDLRHLERALANLIRNACDHAPAGSRVTVTARVAGGDSLVTVEDQGPGIAPQDLVHVFDRFYRADPARSREHGGSGLGLSIARWALRRMGGDLTAESTVGSGTRMTMALPTPRA
jgi:two-component system sensor histidine kinase CiaH